MNNTQDMRKFMDIINENNDPVSDLELEEEDADELYRYPDKSLSISLEKHNDWEESVAINGRHFGSILDLAHAPKDFVKRHSALFSKSSIFSKPEPIKRYGGVHNDTVGDDVWTGTYHTRIGVVDHIRREYKKIYGTNEQDEIEEELQEDEHTKNAPGSSLINVKGEEVPNSVVMSVHHDGKVHGYAYRERGHITLVQNNADTGETTKMILSHDSYRILCDWIRGGE